MGEREREGKGEKSKLMVAWSHFNSLITLPSVLS